MDSAIFLLFAMALALYFTWALNREFDYNEEEKTEGEGHVHCDMKTNNSKKHNSHSSEKYIRNRSPCIAKSLKSDSETSVKYDSDYAELQLLVDNLTPVALFNPAVLPLSTTGKGEKRDVFPHANKFVYKLGKKAGIGLRLIDIRNIKRETTETQTRYDYELVLQRDTPVPCKRMAIVGVKMVLDFDQPREAGFFEDYMLSNEPTPKLESITILKYVGQYLDLQSEAVTQFYAFDGDETANFVKQNDIKKIVSDTRKKHDLGVRDLNILIDENGDDAQDYQSRIPDEYDAVPGTSADDNRNRKGAAAGTRLVSERLRHGCN